MHRYYSGVIIALRPFLCEDIGRYIQKLCEIRENFSNVLLEIPKAAYKLFRMKMKECGFGKFKKYTAWYKMSAPKVPRLYYLTILKNYKN